MQPIVPQILLLPHPPQFFRNASGSSPSIKDRKTKIKRILKSRQSNITNPKLVKNSIQQQIFNTDTWSKVSAVHLSHIKLH
jgi:hypothetical protein